MSRDDTPGAEVDPSSTDASREPERVIDADADVPPPTDAESETDTSTDSEAQADASADTDGDVDSSADTGTSTDSSGETDVDATAESTGVDETADTDPAVEAGATEVDSSEETDVDGRERAESAGETDVDGRERVSGAGTGDGVRGYGAWTLFTLLLQAATTVGLVAVTAQSVPRLDSPLVAPGVPSYVYVYAGLGAVGYTFTRAVTVDVTGERLADWTVRTFAALPLAAGTYLLAAILVGGGVGDDGGLTRRRLAGLALVTGLFVNTAYRRLDGLATRLLGASE